jgi:hypothetical protein
MSELSEIYHWDNDDDDICYDDPESFGIACTGAP